MLGSMAFFGMALSEVIILQRDGAPSKIEEDNPKRVLLNAQKEARLLIEEAKLKADKMIYQVQQGVNDMVERKNQIERRLKEFIAAERELIKKYESDEE